MTSKQIRAERKKLEDEMVNVEAHMNSLEAMLDRLREQCPHAKTVNANVRVSDDIRAPYTDNRLCLDCGIFLE